MSQLPSDPADLPDLECDVIMKGGITSGVVYPLALARFARTYRLRRLGGASAGAIGAAFGAAAEHGRQSPAPEAGIHGLTCIPDQLKNGALANLFQPQAATRPLKRLLLAATGHERSGPATIGAARVGAIAAALVAGWPWAAALGALPGVAGLVLAFVTRPWWAAVLVGLLAGATLVAGVVIALGWAVSRTLTRDVPANGFGICTGLSAPGGTGPGFTEWLSQRINVLAGRDPHSPLLYGHLWTGGHDVALLPSAERRVDLAMVTTCLTQGRPYEMPWQASTFFYEPHAWAKLFPPEVMQALADAPRAEPDDPNATPEWRWEEDAAAARSRPLRRMPAPEHLPVIVSVRLSLSFPLLISAIPLWQIDRRSPETTQAVRARRHGQSGPDPAFHELWFTDGGFSSNFPVHLFDDALPVRPAFAVNLGSFLPGRLPSVDQRENIEYATSNRALSPSHRPLAASGWAAIAGFFSAALAASREWQDASQLDTPGMRDRVVRVLQSDTEGGLNLYMEEETINGLAARGEAAADALTAMFTKPTYAHATTGWDNHRWVRHRALLAALPPWLTSIARGTLAMADLDPSAPPSYPLTVPGRDLADRLTSALLEGADAVADPDSAAGVTDLLERPRPLTRLRRVPML